MNTFYKHNIKGIAMALCCSLAFSACSDWTDTESLTLNNPSLEGQNPELNQAYLAALRAYKQSEHKVLIAKFDNKSTLPTGQSEHLAGLPDSTDLVILNTPDNLHPITVQEMGMVREQRGTRTIFTIDYSSIEKEFNDLEEGGEEPESRNEGEENADKFLDFCAQKVDYYLSLYGKYGYDGINVVYNGVFPLSLPETERLQLQARQELFFGKVQQWFESNSNAVLTFEGKPQNLMVGLDLVKQAKYVIIPALDATTADKLLYTAEMAVVDGISADNFVFGVTMPSLTDEKDKSGYFTELDADGKPLYAVKGAAAVVVSDRGSFGKAGVCVDQAQTDYFSAVDYKNIKESIYIMNPSPLY